MYVCVSVCRYMIIHESLSQYAAAGVQIGDLQAINITSTVAAKGHDFYHCQVRANVLTRYVLLLLLIGCLCVCIVSV